MRERRSADESPHVGRDYLRSDEANAVIEAAGRVGRQRLRDQVLLRLMYRHGLRASEAQHTKWADFDLTPGSGLKTFHVRRLKGSNDSVHTLDRDEASALRPVPTSSIAGTFEHPSLLRRIEFLDRDQHQLPRLVQRCRSSFHSRLSGIVLGRNINHDRAPDRSENHRAAGATARRTESLGSATRSATRSSRKAP